MLFLKILNNVLDTLYKKYDLIQVNSSVLIQFQCRCFIKMVLYRMFDRVPAAAPLQLQPDYLLQVNDGD